VEAKAPRSACGAGGRHRSGPGRADNRAEAGPGRDWAGLCKPLIDAVGPVLGEDPARPFCPRDDRIVSLALHHAIDTGIARDVITGAWWTRR